MEVRRIESLQRIPNKLAAIKLLTESFIHDLERQGYDSEINLSITQGFTEALANAFKHGNLRNPAKCITVCYRLDCGWAEIIIRDEGSGFDPRQMPDAASDDALVRPSGRSVMLMRSLFDDVQFLHGGRSVRLTKRVSAAKACAA
jgi:anti-sigma regulatory factor (Ser/Thr protein kinase)